MSSTPFWQTYSKPDSSKVLTSSGFSGCNGVFLLYIERSFSSDPQLFLASKRKRLSISNLNSVADRNRAYLRIPKGKLDCASLIPAINFEAGLPEEPRPFRFVVSVWDDDAWSMQRIRLVYSVFLLKLLKKADRILRGRHDPFNITMAATER